MSRLSFACFLDPLSGYRHFRRFHCLVMVPPTDDPFVLPASITTRVANNLLDTLNIMLGHLPESELLIVRSGLGDSLQLADHLLSDMGIASALESFSMVDGT